MSDMKQGVSAGSASSGANRGATSIIRKKLNFEDEILWKQFSSRRLQLVESLSLSSKKASEQDEEIKICAKTLMDEFHFPLHTLPEFDKLVRLAIQSVRRNKKRSEKRLASKLEAFTSDDEALYFNVTNSTKKTKTDPNDNNRNTYNHNENERNESNLLAGKEISDEDNSSRNYLSIPKNLVHHGLNSDNNHGDMAGNEFTFIPSNDAPPSNLSPETPGKLQGSETQESRLAINSLLEPVIQDLDKLPSIKKLDENPEFSKNGSKILHLIKNSKSCYDFSKNSSTDYNRSQNYDLLEEFGSNCITSAVLYTLEKWFDHLLPDSASYIKLRLKSDLTLGLIIKSLDSTSVEVNTLSNYVASQLFKKLVGGCVKDFGFDSTLNPLCHIFHSIILKDYPIITKNKLSKNGLSNNTNISSHTAPSKKIHENFFKDASIIDSTIGNKSVTTPFTLDPFPTSPESHRATDTNDPDVLMPNIQYSHIRPSNEMPDFPLSTAHIPIPPISEQSATNNTTLSHTNSYLSINNLPPPILRSKQYTQVVIKFKDKELKCRYCMDSNAPPTILELITNCKQAFGIINSARILNLKNLRSNSIIKSDHELERILRMASMLSSDGNGETNLELVFTSSTQGFLSLNYENEPSNNNISTLNSETEKINISNQEQKPPLNKSLSSESSALIGRYLPPPRPLRPETANQLAMGGMKFQPLL